MITVQDIAYMHPNRDLLFSNITFTINKHDKVALVGNNGEGKSTLLQLLAGKLLPFDGVIRLDSAPYYVPQHYGQYDELTVAGALMIEDKLNAYREILAGTVTDKNLSILDDDWGIEERCAEAFNHWEISNIDLCQPMHALSGGQKTKVFLAGILIHSPKIILLDEPSNHLDVSGRKILYQYIESTHNTLVVVSHDKSLLNLFNSVYELSKKGVSVYGGSYSLYEEQKRVESNALDNDILEKEKSLRKAKETEKEAAQRRQKLDSRGKGKQEKAGLPTISMKTLKNSAEKSTARIKDVHTEKIGNITNELQDLKTKLPAAGKMKINLDSSLLHKGKIILKATDINFSYSDNLLWREGINLQVESGDRVAIKGNNGTGKSTLIKIILGELKPVLGKIERSGFNSIYIDQDYSLINNKLTVYEQAQEFNSGALQEHDIKMRLNRFLFTASMWDKPCAGLSGGERMKLTLCCLTISSQAPDVIILDEPTNNLDLQNLEILITALKSYKGTLLVISHDEYFLKAIDVTGEINLNS